MKWSRLADVSAIEKEENDSGILCTCYRMHKLFICVVLEGYKNHGLYYLIILEPENENKTYVSEWYWKFDHLSTENMEISTEIEKYY